MSDHPRALVGLLVGLVLGLAGGIGGFGAFLLVLVLGIVGVAVGAFLDGDLDLSALSGDRRGRRDRLDR